MEARGSMVIASIEGAQAFEGELSTLSRLTRLGHRHSRIRNCGKGYFDQGLRSAGPEGLLPVASPWSAW